MDISLNLDDCLPSGDLDNYVTQLLKDFRMLCDAEDKRRREEETMAASILERCNALEKEIQEYVENGRLKEVSECKRQAFAASSVVKANLILRSTTDAAKVEALKTLDVAMLIGAPIKGCNVLKTAETLHQELAERLKLADDKRSLICSSNKWECGSSYSIEEDVCRTDSDSDNEESDSVLQLIDDIPFEECPSVTKFLEFYFEKRKPVKLERCMEGWPALIKWKYLGYLKRLAGLRTIPVEMGDYTRSCKIKLTTFSAYLEDLVTKKSASTCGYMAQHQLLDQEPRFQRDVIVPDYCALSEEGNKLTYVWLGPAGSSTPLHFDPHHNFLAQVVGRKRIILFSPKDSDKLYPRDDGLANNSQVDISKPDLVKFPKFLDAMPLACTLHPGEMLYIPVGWWHSVVSLDVSLSVNFFF